MVITVQCPSCSASYPVDTGKVPADGVYARCSGCEGVFLVEPPGEGEAPPAEVGSWIPVAEPGAPAGAPEMEASAQAEGGVEVEEVESTGWGEALPEAEEAPLPTLEEAPAAEAEPEVEIAPEEPWEAAAELEAAPEEPELEAAAEALELEAAPDLPELEAAPEEAPAASPEAEAAPAPAFTFGRRDPHDKARRLARVLVSDMIMYNPERHARALENGTLKEDFDEEIKKSWNEYVEQVGDDIANSTTYFDEALNDILARGQALFP